MDEFNDDSGWDEELDRQEQLCQAVNAEFVYNHKTLLRTWEEWEKFQTPFTYDDLLDTMLYVRRLPHGITK